MHTCMHTHKHRDVMMHACIHKYTHTMHTHNIYMCACACMHTHTHTETKTKWQPSTLLKTFFFNGLKQNPHQHLYNAQSRTQQIPIYKITQQTKHVSNPSQTDQREKMEGAESERQPTLTRHSPDENEDEWYHGRH